MDKATKFNDKPPMVQNKLSFTLRRILTGKKSGITRNQEGFVLVVSLLVLVILAILAFAMSRSTVFEILIAGNEKIATEQFFKADAGINIAIAENQVPKDSFLPASAAAPGPFLSCNTPQGQQPFARYDLDGDGTFDTTLYALQKYKPVPTDPPEVKIVSCAVSGSSVAQIAFALQYGQPPGGLYEDDPLKH